MLGGEAEESCFAFDVFFGAVSGLGENQGTSSEGLRASTRADDLPHRRLYEPTVRRLPTQGIPAASSESESS
jgi:hypothetical protein